MATAEEKAAAKAAKEAEAAAAKAAKEAEKAAAKAAKEAAEEGGKDQVSIKHRDHTGQVVTRVFSKEVHGADFKTLADEFRTKHAARIVK